MTNRIRTNGKSRRMTKVARSGAESEWIGEGTAIGWKQILGTVVGVIVVLDGVWLALNKPAQKK